MTDHDDIEILDVASLPGDGSSESVSTRGSNRWLPVAVVLVSAIGVAALATAGGDDATAPTTTETPPTVTVSTPSPTTTPERNVEPRPGVVVGEGPDLRWELVDADTGAVDFRWVDGGFVGVQADGSAVSIRPNDEGGSLTVLGGVTDARPVDSSEPVIGEPSDNPALLRFFGGPEVVLEPVAAPSSDLVTQVVTVDAERIGDRVLILQRSEVVLDADRFRERTSIELATVFGIEVTATDVFAFGAAGEERAAISDTELTVDDLDALRLIDRPEHRLSIATAGEGTAQIVEPGVDRIDWIATIGDEFLVGGNLIFRSSDGLNWDQTSNATPRFGGLLPPGPDGVLTGLTFDRDLGFLTVSSDAGREWAVVGRPIEDTWQTASVAPIVAMTGWQDDPAPSVLDTLELLTPEWRLVVEEDGSAFELSTRDGTTILRGSTSDPATGFRYAAGSQEIWFVLPATGEELARFPLQFLASGLATARTEQGDPQLVAFADLSATAPDETQEWSLAPIDELFGSTALAVEIIPGDGWFLADVITTEGRDLYTARVAGN